MLFALACNIQLLAEKRGETHRSLSLSNCCVIIKGKTRKKTWATKVYSQRFQKVKRPEKTKALSRHSEPELEFMGCFAVLSLRGSIPLAPLEPNIMGEGIHRSQETRFLLFCSYFVKWQETQDRPLSQEKAAESCGVFVQIQVFINCEGIVRKQAWSATAVLLPMQNQYKLSELKLRTHTCRASASAAISY